MNEINCSKEIKATVENIELNALFFDIVGIKDKTIETIPNPNIKIDIKS